MGRKTKSTLRPGVGALAALVVILVLLPTTAMAELKVVTTVGDLAAMSEAILQDDGETVALVRPSEDPHFVDPRPSFARHLNDADMVVYIGLDLEIGWLPSLIDRARNPDIRRGQVGHFDASEFIQPRQVPAGAIDRSMGDVHPGGNPHYTTDPRQMARVALAFGNALGEIAPSKADEFHRRSREFARDCIRLAQKWEDKFEELSREARQIVSYHKTWAYVTNWLDIEDRIQIEPKPGVPPNPRHVSKVVDTIERHRVPVVLQLEYYPTSTADSLAERTGVTVLSVPGQTGQGGDYFEHIEEIVRPLYEAMKRAS